MKQLPTPLRLLLMLCICLLAFSPAAYAACPHSTCPDGSCNIDSSYDDEGGYVGKPVGDRPVHFDTINICGDELCWDGNCGDTPTEDDDAPAPCPYDCSRCDSEDDCDTCRRCIRYAADEEEDEDEDYDGTLCWGDYCEDEDADDGYHRPGYGSSNKPGYGSQRPDYGYGSSSRWSLFSAISSIMQGNSYFERFSPLLQMLLMQSYNHGAYDGGCSRPNYHGYYDAEDGEESMKPSYNYIDADLIAFRSEVLRLVNAERAKVGLPALQSSNALHKAAQVRADEISTDYGHDRPDGSSCFTVLQEKSISYNYAGENIASGQTTPQQVVREWMNSPGHRANILNTKYTHLGIGITENSGGKYGGYSWSQMFIG
ncbi:MAG: hypothetical protein IJF62_00825 [Firmicutes bacterium]|nr:hypothetical protein [Bacillota bacterium]